MLWPESTFDLVDHDLKNPMGAPLPINKDFQQFCLTWL
jgi:hypothetical protein